MFSIYQVRCHRSLFHNDSTLLRSLWRSSGLMVTWYIVRCFIMTVHYCVLCDATHGSLSLGISNITRRISLQVLERLKTNECQDQLLQRTSRMTSKGSITIMITFFNKCATALSKCPWLMKFFCCLRVRSNLVTETLIHHKEKFRWNQTKNSFGGATCVYNL